MVILSEEKARVYEPARREVCISITRPGGPAPNLSRQFLGTLRLTFSDIAGPSPFTWDVLFDDQHARQIIEFVTKWEAAERIVIHCMAGQGRSAGVAMGLCDLFAWDLADLEERYPLWNTWVRQELVRVGKDFMQRRG